MISVVQTVRRGNQLTQPGLKGFVLPVAGHRVLLFSQMTRALDVIQDYLDLRAVPHLRLDGTTKSQDRCHFFLCYIFKESPRATAPVDSACGYNLQSSSYQKQKTSRLPLSGKLCTRLASRAPWWHLDLKAASMDAALCHTPGHHRLKAA